jgi:hypothetical protein
MISKLKLALTAALLSIAASSAQATTVDFAFTELGVDEATGSFSYPTGTVGMLGYSDLSAFSITVAGVPYDLAFAEASSNYSYFAYDTVSNSFVAGTGTGDYGPLDELLGAFKNDPLTSGFYFKPPNSVNVGGFTEITTSTYDHPYDSIVLTAGDGSAVPEPGTLALFCVGLFGLGFIRRRKLGA